VGTLSFVFSFVLSLGRITFFGRAWAECTRGACNEPLRADCGQKNLVKSVRRHDLSRSHASMNKQKKTPHGRQSQQEL